MNIMGVPVMTKRSFIETERVIGMWWWIALEESMLAAGKKKKTISYKKITNTIKEYQPSQLLLMEDGANAHTNIVTTPCLV